MTKTKAAKKEPDVAVFVRLPAEVAKYLDDWAKATDMTRSQVVRAACRKVANEIRVRGVQP